VAFRSYGRGSIVQVLDIRLVTVPRCFLFAARSESSVRGLKTQRLRLRRLRAALTAKPPPIASSTSVDGSGTLTGSLFEFAHSGRPPPWPCAGGVPPRPRPFDCAWTAVALATMSTNETTNGS